VTAARRQLVAAVLWAASSACAGGAEVPAERVDRAIDRAVAFLRTTIGKSGQCRKDFSADDDNHGGVTALVVYALAWARLDDQDPVMRRAIDWLCKARLKGTYAVSMRACALAMLKDPKYLPLLKRDAGWLLKAPNRRGGYTYDSQGREDTGVFDNSNTQMAMLGVAAAAQAGVDIPEAYWRMMERHWTATQHTDGGWGYRGRPEDGQGKTYGSMTAAGLASMYICLNHMPRGAFDNTRKPPRHEAVDDALAWLEDRCAVDENPVLGPNHYYYWMYSLARVGAASGRKYIAGRDWYARGAARLLRLQHADGSWGYVGAVRETCFVLLFLTRSRPGVLLNKLRYTGWWNARPRDAANLVRWISYHLEHPLGWQSIGFDAVMADWHEAPILYLSGAGPFDVSDAQVRRLRTFVLQGGTILTEAAGSNPGFTLDVRRLCARMFPAWPLRPLDANHPIYTCHFAPETDRSLAAVDNGVRPLVIHSPRDLSLALQMGAHRSEDRAAFELAANIALFVTDSALPTRRQPRAWPAEPDVQPAATVRVARLDHPGNSDPEPLAWQRLSRLAAARHRLRLRVDGPMDIAELTAARWPVAAITGTEAFELSDRQAAVLKRYLADGGTLIADAAGGSRAFARAVEEHLLPLLPAGRLEPITLRHPIFRRPVEIERVRYTRALSLLLGTRRRRPRLEGVRLGDRLAVIYSRDDLTAGLAGCRRHGLRGYAPPTAVDLMINILHYAARSDRPKAATRPSKP
jgi:hypothetical protein